MTNKTLLAAIVMGAISSSAMSAQAADGTINFTGTITDASCTITADSKNQTVSLGKIGASSFSAANVTSSGAKFDINLSNCPASISAASVKFVGATDANNGDLLALTAGPTSAKGVAVGIYEQDTSTLIPLMKESASKPLSSTQNTKFSFIAKYVSTAASVTPGEANAVADFTVTYN